MGEEHMEDDESGRDAAWDRARERLFRAVPPPTRAQTEAFTRRVLARIPEEAPAWRPWRWLTPSLAFSAAALVLSLTVPMGEEETADVAGFPAVPAAAEDPYGFGVEER